MKTGAAEGRDQMRGRGLNLACWDGAGSSRRWWLESLCFLVDLLLLLAVILSAQLHFVPVKMFEISSGFSLSSLQQ